MSTSYLLSCKDSYPAYGPASGTTTPKPTITSFTPTSGAVSTDVVITGTNFTSATLVSINSGAVASFTVNSATQITATLNSAQTTGRVRVTTPGGTAVSTADFTVATAATQFVVPQTADYGLLAMSRVDAGGNVQRSYGATLKFTCNDNTVKFTLLNTEAAGNGQPSSITVLQPGQVAQTIRPAGGSVAADYSLTLLGPAPYTATVILGTLEDANEAEAFPRGRVVQKITFGASGGSLVAPTTQSECVVFVTDSIGTGTGTTTPETEGWLVKLRALDTGRDYLNNGYQSRQMRVALASNAAIDALLDELATATAAYTTVTIAVCLGTNDYNQTPSYLAGLAGNFLTRGRARFPNARLIIASPVVADSQYANETNLPPIRAALKGAVQNSGLSNVYYVDGLQLLGDNTQLAGDRVHPIPNGHVIIANNWLQQLQSNVTGTVVTVDSAGITYTPNSSAFYTFHNTQVATPNYLMCAQNYVNNDPGQGPIRGAKINIPFTGTQALIQYHIENQGSTMRVSVDGVKVGVVNQYNSVQVPNYSFLTPKMAAGNHILTLEKDDDTDSKIFWWEGLIVYGGSNSGSNTTSATLAAFFNRHTNAGGALTSNQKSAITTCINGLDSAGILAKIKELGLMVGGTAATHALGFFNVATTTWAGGVTHSATGALGDGSTGYGNLNLNPAAGAMSLNSGHLSYYSRQDRGDTQSEREMGVADEANGTTATRMLLSIQGGAHIEISNANEAQAPATSTAGYFVSSRQSATVQAAYRNGTQYYTGTKNSSSLPNGPLLLLAQGGLDGTPAGFSTKECCFWSVGAGLTSNEVSQLTTLVQNLQTALGRAV